MRPVSKKRAAEQRKRKKVTDAMKREGPERGAGCFSRGGDDGMSEHEWIHDASCAECGAEARRHVFPAHELEPLEGGLIDKFGVLWPTCRRCGRCHGPLLAVLEEPKP